MSQYRVSRKNKRTTGAFKVKFVEYLVAFMGRCLRDVNPGSRDVSRTIKRQMIKCWSDWIRITGGEMGEKKTCGKESIFFGDVSSSAITLQYFSDNFRCHVEFKLPQSYS